MKLAQEWISVAPEWITLALQGMTAGKAAVSR